MLNGVTCPRLECSNELATARAKSVARPSVGRSRTSPVMAERRARMVKLLAETLTDKDIALAAMLGVSRSLVRHWLGKDGQTETAPLAILLGLDAEARAKVYAAIEAECARAGR